MTRPSLTPACVIETRLIPGEQIHSSSSSGSLVIPNKRKAGDSEELTHARAADALARALNWTGLFLYGKLPDGEFVFVPICGGVTDAVTCENTVTLGQGLYDDC